MTAADLAAYRVAERPPLCGRYRAFTICGMGPPSSGGVAVLQMLAFIEDRDLGRAPNADAAHWIAEAGRLAFADRNLYVADPDFVAVPVRGLLDPDYLRTRAALMGERSMGVAQPGVPPFARRGGLAPSLAVEDGTSHVSIVDAQGDAVALTTTIESGFGARVVTEAGFLLNNELTDFDFRPEREGLPVVNRVEGGKRPRSSMAPTIVFDAHGRLHAVLGSPGGSQIILYVVKTLVAMLDWGLDPQSAVDLANFGSRNGPTELEAGSEAQAWRPALEARGHRVTLLPMTSGAQAILVTPRGFEGGADGRREGVAVGD
jgi:gamma-glutamyltranspeptidase/glutathione hydrolase